MAIKLTANRRSAVSENRKPIEIADIFTALGTEAKLQHRLWVDDTILYE